MPVVRKFGSLGCTAIVSGRPGLPLGTVRGAAAASSSGALRLARLFASFDALRSWAKQAGGVCCLQAECCFFRLRPWQQSNSAGLPLVQHIVPTCAFEAELVQGHGLLQWSFMTGCSQRRLQKAALPHKRETRLQHLLQLRLALLAAQRPRPLLQRSVRRCRRHCLTAAAGCRIACALACRSWRAGDGKRQVPVANGQPIPRPDCGMDHRKMCALVKHMFRKMLSEHHHQRVCIVVGKFKARAESAVRSGRACRAGGFAKSRT